MAVVARDDSPEAKVFRRHYAVLVSAIQEPESLADGLFSRNVIGMGLLQELQLDSLTKAKKNRKLLLAVQDQLVVNPCKFTEVVEALQGYGTLELTVERLQSDYFAATQKPNLEQLEVELRHVRGWVHLGLCLHLPKHSLDEIHASHSSGVDALGKCKIKMLAMWLKRSKNPTWSAFIAALLDARLWSTASKIATKYGIELPSKVLPKGKAPPQIEDVVQDAQQVKIVNTMRENVELKHVELHEINEGIEQNEKEMQMLEEELTSIKKSLQSKERYTGLLMSDLQVQQLESACKEDKKQHIESQIRRLELRGSPIPDEVRKQFDEAQESIASCRLKSGQLESQIKSLREASGELALQLRQMSLNVDDIAKELDGLHIQKEELQKDVHMKEQELDSCLLGKNATTPFVPANAEVAYYNVMMCAGRVEVKLRQSELEEYERKLMEKEAEVENVRENLTQQQKKLQELKEQSQKEAKYTIQPSSSDYQYAYMHMQSKNEMEAYELEQRISKLEAENLQYRIQLAVAGSQKGALETEMQALIQEVVSLKTAQASLQRKIEKCTPPLLQKPKTQPPVSPNTAQRRPQLPPSPQPKHKPSPSEARPTDEEIPITRVKPMMPFWSESTVRSIMPYWYQPNITREEAIDYVRRMEPGSFIVRDSLTVSGGFALTIKVTEKTVRRRRKLDEDATVTEDMCITHFLIEPHPEGVTLRGWNERAFKSLPEFITEHMIDKLCLPCQLVLPKGGQNYRRKPATMKEALITGAACDLVYLGSVDVPGPGSESLLGQTVQQLKSCEPSISIVTFKVSKDGITLTDNINGMYIKRLYIMSSVTYCGLDPNDTRWDFPSFQYRGDVVSLKNKPCFGMFHRNQDSYGYSCLMFVELDSSQPVDAVTNYVQTVMKLQHK